MPDRRVGDRQKVCDSEVCKRKRRQAAQRRWSDNNPGYFKGNVYGFVFILSYSRYLYGRFYPKQTMEFFLEGHTDAYKEIDGVPHRGRYDNLKSVVIKRKPEGAPLNGEDALRFAAGRKTQSTSPDTLPGLPD